MKSFIKQKTNSIMLFFSNPRKAVRYLYQTFIYALLISISYIFLYPIFRMISMSFMSRMDIIDPEVLWIPTSLTFTNFRVASFVMNLPGSLWSTLWVITLFALSQTLVTAMTGFSLARFNFKFKKIWFAFILISFIIPLPVILIPRIMVFLSIQQTYSFQLIGTIYPQLALSILGQGVNSAIAILIFYNFFKMIPETLDQAAQIDGANAVQVFYHIIIKMSLTAITIVFLFSVVWNYNETYVTNTFIRSGIDMISIRLASFDGHFASIGGSLPGQSGEARINEAYKMAGTFLSMLPLLILYLFSQRQFIEGIENTGITGE